MEYYVKKEKELFGDEIIIITYSLQGGRLASRLSRELKKAGYRSRGYLFYKYQQEELASFQEADGIVKEAFFNRKALIFVSAAGIAVRKIAPYVNSKLSDSAVVVLDDGGNFAVSLLSGHLGGANELTLLCARMIGAVPVITTATDVHHKFAVDNFAKENQLFIQDVQLAKEISAQILAGKKVGFCTEETISVEGTMPEELAVERSCSYGIRITPFDKENNTVFPVTLKLIAKQVTLGIGCKRGIGQKEIEQAVLELLCLFHIERQALKQVCSIDLKAEETGLIAFCRNWQLPFVTFSKEVLQMTEGSVSSSEFVRQVTGVDNVCERSALAGSGKKGKLLIPKQISHGITLAAAIEEIKVKFS